MRKIHKLYKKIKKLRNISSIDRCFHISHEYSGGGVEQLHVEFKHRCKKFSTYISLEDNGLDKAIVSILNDIQDYIFTQNHYVFQVGDKVRVTGIDSDLKFHYEKDSEKNYIDIGYDGIISKFNLDNNINTRLVTLDNFDYYISCRIQFGFCSFVKIFHATVS